MKDITIQSRLVAILLACMVIFCGLFHPQKADAVDTQYVPNADLVTSFTVNPTEVNHTENIYVDLSFAGQSEDAGAPKYIHPGTKIIIPIHSNGATVESNSTMPQQKGVRTTFTPDKIIIEFTEEVKNMYDIQGSLRFTLRGINTQEDSKKSVDIGDKRVYISNTKGGDTGVFAYKTGVMYGDSKPGYVTWFIRGNTNGDSNNGGPLIINDTLGANQKLDSSGIAIALYWGANNTKPMNFIITASNNF